MSRTASIVARLAAGSVVLCSVACNGGDGTGGGDGDVHSDTWSAADFDAEAAGWLLDVWGTAEDDRWIAGGRPEAGVLLHHAGAGWETVDVGVDVPLLNWVHGFAEDDVVVDGVVVVVGNDGTALHWNGAAWSREPTPTDEDLWGVWGAAPDNLWAVGGSGASDSSAVLLHWDGGEWTAATLPALERPNVRALFKVWGTSASNVYAVGQQGVVLHWNGSEWMELQVGASDDLISLWGTGPDEILAVGGRANGIISRWDGESWTTAFLTPLPGINGVWMNGDGVARLAISDGRVARLPAGAMSTAGLEVELRLDSFELGFHAVFETPDGVATAVGGNFMAFGALEQGVAYEHAAP